MDRMHSFAGFGWLCAAALVITLMLAFPVAAESIEVTSPAELNAALSRAKGGEVIELPPGDYGSLSIKGKVFSARVTLRAQIRHAARFDAIDIAGSGGIRVEGVHVVSPVNGGRGGGVVTIRDGSRGIQIIDCEINGRIDDDYDGQSGIVTKGGVEDVVFSGNAIHHVNNGGILEAATGLRVVRNQIDFIGNDALKFIGVRDVLIERNTGAQHIFPSNDAHLDFIQFQGADSRDIVLRGNVFLPKTRADVQGIFMDDARFSNVLIEGNAIVTGMIRGISVSNGSNVVVRHNTVLDVDGVGSKATLIMAEGAEVVGNIMSTYPQDRRLGVTDGNLYLQLKSRGVAYHYGAYLKRAMSAPPLTLAGIGPKVGTLAEKYGHGAMPRP